MVKEKPTKKFLFSDQWPQFFKIYFPDQCSHQLRIPPTFVEEFNGDLPFDSVITSPSMESWRVDVNRVDNNLYFQKGWHEFVQGNELEFGDFLIFCYNGDSEFYVKIYGKDGCKKVPTEKTRKTLAVQENQTFKHKKCKQLRCENSRNGLNKMTLRPRIPMATTEPDKDSKDAGNIISAHPFFEVTLTPSYVASGYLNIPLSFFRSNVDLGRKNILLRVSDKLWPVKLVTYGYGIRLARFSEGWRSFVKEHTLRVGDVCVFELIEREEYSEFYVKIYGKDGCPKVHAEKTQKTLANQENRTFKHKKFKQLRFEDSGNVVKKMTSRPRVPVAIKKPSIDISNFVSAHPFFKVAMTASFVASGRLSIPSTFYRSYIDEGIKSVFLRGSDKLWPVKLITRKYRARFCQGWRSFVRENALQVGDVCVFELIEREEFEVLICRCLEE